MRITKGNVAFAFIVLAGLAFLLLVAMGKVHPSK